MFEARLRNALMLKNILSAIKELFPQTKWRCLERGVFVYGMDVSQTSILKLEFIKEAFDKYRWDRDHTFSIQTKSLYKILKYATNEDMINIINDNQKDKISIVMEPIVGIDFTEYSLRLIDYDITEVDVEQEGNPEYMECASMCMPSTKWQRICHNLSQVGERLTIGCDETVVRFRAGGEIATGCVYLYENPFYTETINEVVFKLTEKCSQTFRLKVLNQFTKATALTPQVLIRMRAFAPLEINYQINVQKVSPNSEPFILRVADLRFYLSPDVDIED